MRLILDKLSITLIVLSIFLQFPGNTFCQEHKANDTLSRNHPIWNSKAVRIISVPIILFSGSAGIWGVREDVRTLRNRYLPNFRYHYDDYLQYAPVVAVLGLHASGVKGKNKIGRA